MRPDIDWENVAEAIEFYRGCGYSYIEVPWVISDEALTVTLPPDKIGQRCQDGALVGSAEQAFIQMMLDGELEPGRYVAATPCFRDDDPDEWHQRAFFKVELIEFSLSPIHEPTTKVTAMAFDAGKFFITRGADDVELVETEQGFDLELGGIELGSYGHRSYKNFHWIYGTGYADPRFTQAIHRQLG